MKKQIIHVMLMVLAVMSALPAAAGVTAVDFTAVDIDGAEIRLSDFKDKVVVLDFWATWCRPCREEIPNLIDIKKTFSGKNLVIISIDGFERNGDAQAAGFVKQNRMDWIHIINRDKGAEIAKLYEVRFIPSIFVIKNGQIVAQGLRGQGLKNKLKELLN
jgi:thiol-disulfide isomerase/thioredoxin